MLDLNDIRYDDHGVWIGERYIPSSNPRAEFARQLDAATPDLKGKHIEPEPTYGRQRIHPTAQIGSPGFGYARTPEGWLHIPSCAGVVLGDDVEIYPFVDISSGTREPTRIGAGTKINALAKIGHNVEIGEHCIIGTGAVICGGAKLGNWVWVSPGALIRGDVTVGDEAFVGMGAVVVKDVPSGVTVVGNPARILNKEGEVK